MIVSCPECSQKLRAPDDRQAIRLTCSTCGHQWEVRGGETSGELALAADTASAARRAGKAKSGAKHVATEPERKEVLFRCAKTSGRFKALFKRNKSTDQFVFEEVRTLDDGPSSNDGISQKSTTLKTEPERQDGDIDVEMLDFGEWYCPHCGHDGKTIFVKCSGCGELVCGARVKDKFLSRKKVFRCHDGCGRKGEISIGIDRINARALRQRKAGAPTKAARESAQIESKPSLRLPKR